MADKKSFVLYNDYLDNIELLTMEQRGILLTAVFMYSMKNDLPDMDGMTTMAFSFIKKQMDRDREKYESIVQKRKEAGKQGGRPKACGIDNKAKKANGFFEKQTKAKKPDNDTVTVNDTDTVNDNEINTISPETENSAPNTIISIMLNDGTDYAVSEIEYVYYTKIYPGIDVKQELRKMAGWCYSNSKNRKTRRGIKKFINGWLSRAQDKAPVQHGLGKQSTEQFYDDMKEWVNERQGICDDSFGD